MSVAVAVVLSAALSGAGQAEVLVSERFEDDNLPWEETLISDGA